MIRKLLPARRGVVQKRTMDNFEWNAGFGNRFGLVHVDFKTQSARPSSVPRGSAKPRGKTVV